MMLAKLTQQSAWITFLFRLISWLSTLILKKYLKTYLLSLSFQGTKQTVLLEHESDFWLCKALW